MVSSAYRSAKVLVLVVGIAGALTGCGSDKKKSTDGTVTPAPPSCAVSAVGKGCVTKAVANVVTLDFTNADAGAQYVVMPFLLDDPTKVSGATDTPFTFKVAFGAAAGGGAGLTTPAEALSAASPGGAAFAATDPAAGLDAEMTPQTYDHGMRTLLNRYDPRRGADQGAGFWRLARQLDAYAQGMGLQDQPQGAVAAGGTGAVEAYFRSGKGAPRARRPQLALAGSGGACPKVGDSISVPPKSGATPFDFTIPAAGSVTDGGDFCVVYAEPPVTPGDAAAVEATIKEVLRRYKQILYKGETFLPANGYYFKPMFVLLDFSNPAQWPSAYQASGAFSSAMSEDMSMPMLFMPTDYHQLTLNQTGTYDPDLQKRLWHGTIAHEMQHAIMDYYRKHVVKNGTLETASIDEGIAHFVEDLFGHGTENFVGFPLPYLNKWALLDALENHPVLHSTDASSGARGAGQTLIYYLVSQKGGVTFDSSGVFTAGPGLDFLSAVVKSAAGKIGPGNIATQFGADLPSLIGNYYGALVADGAGIAGTDAAYTVQDPQPVTDLIGVKKTYGFHFNGNPAQIAHDWTAAAGALTNGMTTPEQEYYATRPLVYTVADPAVPVTFTTKDAIANTAVSVVRIK